MKPLFYRTRVNKAMMLMLGAFCFLTVYDAKSAIIYQAFGPATVDLNNPVAVPNFFGGSLVFGWQQPFLPSARQGLFVSSGTTATVSILTDGSGYALLSEDTQIDASTPGTWSTASSQNLLYSQSVGTGIFDINYLSPSEVGVIGLRSSYEGNFYYGWIEVFNIATNGLSYQISGFLYNDTPDAPVLSGSTDDPSAGSAVPEPSSVGLVALGAAAVYALRRRRDN